LRELHKEDGAHRRVRSCCVAKNLRRKDEALGAADRRVRRTIKITVEVLSNDGRRCTARTDTGKWNLAPVKRGGRRGAPAKARARNLRKDCIVAVLLGVLVSVKNGGS